MRSMRPETGSPAEIARKEQDQQQAPPEDRHRVAGEGGAHQRLDHRRCALTAAITPAGMPSTSASSMAARRARWWRETASGLGRAPSRGVMIEVPKSPCRMFAHIVEELRQTGWSSPSRAQHLEALGGDAALAAHLDGIARHQADQHEGDEHQCQKGGQREAARLRMKPSMAVSSAVHRHPSRRRRRGDGPLRRVQSISHRHHRIHGARAGTL